MYTEVDTEFDSLILDEDQVKDPVLRSLLQISILSSLHLVSIVQVCDELEDEMTFGGKVVDHHTCDFFPERWFDLVIVLVADNTVLFDRLQKRLVCKRCSSS
jgi:broad-specificity NMP kinase